MLSLALAVVATAARPNLIMVVADDFGWNDLGLRNPDMHTPHMDAMAREGLLLERHYVFKFCSPTRSSFLWAPADPLPLARAPAPHAEAIRDPRRSTPRCCGCPVCSRSTRFRAAHAGAGACQFTSTWRTARPSSRAPASRSGLQRFYLGII